MKPESGRERRLSRICGFVCLAVFFACALFGCVESKRGALADAETENVGTANVSADAEIQAGTTNTNVGQECCLHIVTTIFPQYDIVRQIAGDAVSLQMLLKPGEETHSYEPTPQDIIAIQKADLFIYVGGENDAWVEDILDSPEMGQVRTLRLVDCVDMLEERHVEGMQKERQGWFGDEEEERDEHVWTSPRNMMRITERITTELTELDAAHRETYASNRDDYIEELSLLDEQFREVTAGAARQGRNVLLFGDRFPFRYFAEEYGLDYYAAFPGCASDTEPSAATMAFLIRKVKEEKIPVVLKMELSNAQIANAVAEASGAQVRVFFSCHNLTAEQFESGANCLSMMRENLETLKAALEYDGRVDLPRKE